MSKKFTKYYQALHYLDGFLNLPNAYPHDGKNFARYTEYLERMQFFLRLLKNPEKNLRVIHIAGSSGKGSTSSYIQSILTKAGKKTGLFTTPFATSLIEEFKINNKYIDPNEFADLINYLKPFINKAYASCPHGGPSHYEIKTAIALLYFARNKCDYVVLEVGLGGEFDATNAVTNKVATAITNISLDHTDILGKTLPQIALAKAGIIKNNIPLFTTETNPKILKIFKSIASRNKAPIQIVNFQNTNFSNANEALAANICTKLGISSKNIQKGIKAMFLPARFEKMPKDNVIIDGAHSVAKIKFSLKKLDKFKYSRLWVIYASAQNKPAQSILKPIQQVADKLILTRFSNPFRPCSNPYELSKKIKSNKIFMDSENALNFALKNKKNSDLILVTGSFYLAGELRARWYPEKKILTKRTPR